MSLFLDIVHTLEAVAAPCMVIGAFAALVYGSTRTTYDIDIVVDLAEEHIQALVDAYPPPRYNADPQQMRDSIRLGIMFNIIDTSHGKKRTWCRIAKVIFQTFYDLREYWTPK